MANKKEKNLRDVQATNADGYIGDFFEAGIREFLGGKYAVKRAGGIDCIGYINNSKRKIEIKTGAGELGAYDSKALAGVSYIIYCPVVDEGLPIERQEAFMLPRDVFIELLQTANNGKGLYRDCKVNKRGQKIHAIQSFWNRKENRPHSIKAYNALIDGLYNLCNENDDCIAGMDEILETIKGEA